MDQKTPEEKGDDLLNYWRRSQGHFSIPKGQIAPDVKNGDAVYWNDQSQRYERSKSIYISCSDIPATLPAPGKVTFILTQPDGTQHSMRWDEEQRCLIVGDLLPPEGEE
jgi:hypothetical protein